MSYLNSAQWAPSEMSVKYFVEYILTVEHFTAWFPCPHFSLIFYDLFHTLFVAIQLTGTCPYSPSHQVILTECLSKLIGVLFPTNWKQLDRFLLLAEQCVSALPWSLKRGWEWHARSLGVFLVTLHSSVWQMSLSFVISDWGEFWSFSTEWLMRKITFPLGHLPWSYSLC